MAIAANTAKLYGGITMTTRYAELISDKPKTQEQSAEQIKTRILNGLKKLGG